MLDKVKMALRIKSCAFDDEISLLIESAKLDLNISGVKTDDLDNPLIIHAIKIYCKANFGLDNKDSEKYQKSYVLLKEHLALCKEFTSNV